MTARLYGKRAALFPALIRDIEHYFAGSLPKAPAKVEIPANVPWGMDGNDRYGDCGVAGFKHGLQNTAVTAAKAVRLPTDQQVVDYYLTYTHGQDTGVVLSDFLKYVESDEFFGHTVEAYAPVDFRHIPNLQFAIWAYTFAYTGIAVTPEMQEAFQAGQPWELETVLGEPEGGHCIPLVGYDSQYLYAVTWGALQPIAYSAWAHIADEAWAVITGDLAADDLHGLNLDALKADIARLD